MSRGHSYQKFWFSFYSSLSVFCKDRNTNCTLTKVEQLYKCSLGEICRQHLTSSYIWNKRVSTNFKREILWMINSFGKLLCLSLLKRLRLQRVIKFFTHDVRKTKKFWIHFSHPQVSILINLRILEHEEVNLFADKLSHLILKVIFSNVSNSSNGQTFQFPCVSAGDDV